MKKQMLKSALIALAGVGLMSGSALAVPITTTYTADNIVDTFYLLDGVTTDDLAAGDNRYEWRVADTTTIDVAGGKSYSFIWEVTNVGAMSETNPAAFLGEIDFGGAEKLFSGVTWKYAIEYPGITTTDNFNLNWNWINVTAWGYNGGDNIWTENNSGNAVAGISTEAQWIWSINNFKTDGTGDQKLFIRADFTAVPEPTTMFLFGAGLLGLTAVVRKKNLK